MPQTICQILSQYTLQYLVSVKKVATFQRILFYVQGPTKEVTMASSSKKGDDTIEWMGMKLAKKDMKVCKDCKKRDQTSMIEKAVRANHLVCLNLAIQNPPGRKTIDPRRDKFELERALFVAVERNQPKCIQLIMGTWGDACSTNAEGQTPVLIAAEKGFLDCLKV